MSFSSSGFLLPALFSLVETQKKKTPASLSESAVLVDRHASLEEKEEDLARIASSDLKSSFVDAEALLTKEAEIEARIESRETTSNSQMSDFSDGKSILGRLSTDYVVIDEKTENLLEKLVTEEISLMEFTEQDPLINQTLSLLQSQGMVKDPGAEEPKTQSYRRRSSQNQIPLDFIKKPKNLHITCLTIGTRGDIQPFVALCKGFMAEGHRCRIATHDEYKTFVESHGIEFRRVGGNPAELMQLCVNNGMFSVSFIREGLLKFSSFLEDLLNTSWEACQGTDVLIGTPSSMAGIHIAESLKIPFLYAFPFPWTRTSAFPHPFSSSETEIGDQISFYFNYLTRGGLNYMSYILIDKVLWTGIAQFINPWRVEKLRLNPVKYIDDTRVPMLYAFSDLIVPPPTDWPKWIHSTGYWFLDEPTIGWNPPEELVQFLKKGPKPVYIGFGSIVVDDPVSLTNTIIEGIRKAGVRAVVAKGWSSRAKEKSEKETEKNGTVPFYTPKDNIHWPDFIYPVHQVPHDWLFPRVRGVVHHGGAGTTAAGLRAGCPTVIRPFFGDQFFWAARVAELGVGCSLRTMTADTLAKCLVEITTNPEMTKRANELGQKIRSQDGVQNAIKHFYHDLELVKLHMLDEAQTDQVWDYKYDPLAEKEDQGFVEIETS